MRHPVAGLLAASIVAGTTTAAVIVQPTQETRTVSEEPRTARGGIVALEGCLTAKEDAGYILTDAKLVQRGDQATGTSGTPLELETQREQTVDTNYEVQGIDDERLQQFLGQRVHIDGAIVKLISKHSANRTDLPGFRGTVIRKAPGGCHRATK